MKFIILINDAKVATLTKCWKVSVLLFKTEAEYFVHITQGRDCTYFQECDPPAYQQVTDFTLSPHHVVTFCIPV